MSIPPLFTTDVIGVIGDSISTEFGASLGWMESFPPKLRNQLGGTPAPPDRPTGVASDTGRQTGDPLVVTARQPTGYAAQTSPSFITSASPGAKVGDYAAIINTTLVPFIAIRVTVGIVQLGINDSTALVPAATFAAQVATVRDTYLAVPSVRMLIWIGPWAAGEKYPDGANPFDTVPDGIRDKDTQLASLMASTPRCYYISWRTLRIATENATTNPGNVSSGVYTGDGTHPTASPSSPALVSGKDLLADYTISQLSFA